MNYPVDYCYSTDLSCCGLRKGRFGYVLRVVSHVCHVIVIKCVLLSLPGVSSFEDHHKRQVGCPWDSMRIMLIIMFEFVFVMNIQRIPTKNYPRQIAKSLYRSSMQTPLSLAIAA